MKKKEKMNTINISRLTEMATSNKLRDILNNYIENEKIPSVKTAWIEYFLEIKNTEDRLNKLGKISLK
jgi:NADH:ubiquinone oxidoreductase subunit